VLQQVIDNIFDINDLMVLSPTGDPVGFIAV
jgi:hypothetical protein